MDRINKYIKFFCFFSKHPRLVVHTIENDYCNLEYKVEVGYSEKTVDSSDLLIQRIITAYICSYNDFFKNSNKLEESKESMWSEENWIGDPKKEIHYLLYTANNSKEKVRDVKELLENPNISELWYGFHDPTKSRLKMSTVRKKNNRQVKYDEYSCAMKSQFRKTGNQMSGTGNHQLLCASLLAHVFI